MLIFLTFQMFYNLLYILSHPKLLDSEFKLNKYIKSGSKAAMATNNTDKRRYPITIPSGKKLSNLKFIIFGGNPFQ